MGKGEIAHKEQFLLFPQSFLPFGELSAIFTKPEIVDCKIFQIGRVQNLSIWKGLFCYLQKPQFGLSKNVVYNSLPNNKILD